MTVRELIGMSQDLGRFLIYDEATGKTIYNSDFGNCKVKYLKSKNQDKNIVCWHINSEAGVKDE